MLDEDKYWENVREEHDNQHRYCSLYGYEDEETIIESKCLSLDEELEDIEKEYQCSIEEMSEGDLQEIVEKLKGIETLSAKWNREFQCIDYEYEGAYAC